MGIIKVLLCLFLAAFFAWATFLGEGGLQLEKNTTIWLVALALAGLTCALALARRGVDKFYGATVLAAVAALTVFIGASISWSLIPSDTWLELDRMVVYLAVFAAGIGAVRLWGVGWSQLLFALIIATVLIDCYALLTKIAPAWLAVDEDQARLRAPYSYWNALGVIAAFSAILSLWLGTAKQYSRWLTAAGYPLLGISIVTMLLAYSRGALLAAAIAMAVWFILAGPRRLRGLSLLGPALVLAALLTIWAFGQDGLSQMQIGLAERKAAGIELGLLLLAMIALLYLVGTTVDWVAKNRPLSQIVRRRIGIAAIGLVALAPLILVFSLALSQRGLTGSIEHTWRSLSDEQAEVPPNVPSRLTSAASVRARYWREAYRIWQSHKSVGAGAGSYEEVRKRYRKKPLVVAHAHGQIIQAMADIGIVGILLTLLAGSTWLVAAGRSVGVSRQRRQYWSDERAGIITLASVAVAFGAHSAIDWTWYVPGIALPALFTAGWVAGRGPVREGPLDTPWPATKVATVGRVASALLVVATTAVAAWMVSLPQRSQDEVERALTLAKEKKYDQAEAAAREAHKLNPSSVESYFTLSSVLRAAGKKHAGLGPLQEAVQLQPARAETWRKLGDYQLLALGKPQAAVKTLSRAVYLDPLDGVVQQSYLKAKQALENERMIERKIRQLRKRPAAADRT